MAPFKLCGACCDGCGQCCQDSCKLVTNCCSSSLCFYITVTCVLNLPPIVLGVTDLPNLASGCQASYWLLVYWVLCAIHIVAAFYMARAIEQDDSILPSSNQQGMSNFNASGGAGRMKHLFCYDGWMAVYILIVMGFFAWLCLGAGVFITDNDDADCDSTVGTVGIAYGFGWAFVFVGGCALCCSLCCGVMCNPRGNSNPNTHFVNTSHQQSPAQQQQPPPAAAAASTTSSTNQKPGLFGFGSSTTTSPQATPVVPSAPQEIPVASATPIYDDAPSKV